VLSMMRWASVQNWRTNFGIQSDLKPCKWTAFGSRRFALRGVDSSAHGVIYPRSNPFHLTSVVSTLRTRARLVENDSLVSLFLLLFLCFLQEQDTDPGDHEGHNACVYGERDVNREQLAAENWGDHATYP